MQENKKINTTKSKRPSPKKSITETKAPSVASDTDQSRPSRAQLNAIMKSGAFHTLFDPEAHADLSSVDSPEIEKIDFTAKTTCCSLPISANDSRQSNLNYDPLEAYKTSGKWVTLWIFSPKGLNLPTWETYGGHLHYSSALKLHSVQIPWYMRWGKNIHHANKKLHMAKMIFQVGDDPYPDINRYLKTAGRTETSLICRALVNQHLPCTWMVRAKTLGLEPLKLRRKNESLPQFIKRLLVRYLHPRNLSYWVRSRFNRWEQYRPRIGA